MAKHLKPPFVSLALLGLAAWLHVWLAPGWGAPLRRVPCAVVLAAFGAGILAWSFAHFLRHRTPPWPGSRPSALVIGGPYRFSRNPMYVATTTLLLALTFIVGSLPFLIPPIGFFLAMQCIYIPHEERGMAERFGDAYAAYRARVRRWL